jgi:hypothetical protein
LCRVSLEGEGVKQMEFPIGDSEIFIDSLSLKEKESLPDPGGFVEAALKDIVDKV